MKHLKRKLVVILTIIVVLITTTFPAFAADDTMTLELNTGSDKMLVNSSAVTVEKPYFMDGTVYLPLTPIFETFGAEILKKETNTFGLIYRDVSLELRAGEYIYYSNQTKKELKFKVRQGLDGLMVPLELINENFDVKTEYNPETGSVKIVMEDDGALSDLSFLTDSIDKPMAGNSYFNWAINVPSGSRMYDKSFNSKYVCIDNESREIILKVNILQAEGQTLEKYYNKVQKNTDSYFDNTPDDKSLNLEAEYPYAEFLYTSLVDEAVVERFYIYNDKVYTVSLTDYTENDPYTITGNSYLMGLLNSFRLDYAGDDELVQDLSNVEFGLVKFENSISFDRTTSYQLWEMNALPDWDLIDPSFVDILNTTLGTSKREYINVAVSDAGNVTDIGKYGHSIQVRYGKYYKPDLYKLISAKESRFNEYKSYNMKYDITLGGTKYNINENFILANGLVYDVSVKIPVDRYAEKTVIYDNILASFKINEINKATFKNNLKLYNIKFGSQRIGPSDKNVLYQNKEFNWNFSIPGYWVKEAAFNDSCQVFELPYSNALVAVETVPAFEVIDDNSFKEKFMIFASLSQYYDLKKTSDENVFYRNMNIREITYRIDDEDEQVFGEVKCRVITKGEYSYCYISTIDDISSSQAALDEFNSIWNSFNIIGD